VSRLTRTSWLIVAAGAAAVVAWLVLVLGFGSSLERRVVSSVEQELIERVRSDVGDILADLESLSQGERGSRIGEARSQRIGRILEPISPGRSDLVYSVRLLDPKGQPFVREERPLDSSPPDEAWGETIRSERGKWVLSVRMSRFGVERRTAAIREEVRAVAFRVLLLGGVLLAVSLLLLWRAELAHRRLLLRRIAEARLAEVGILAAGLAHEIRNPLNSLRLNVQLVEEELRELGDGPGKADRLRLAAGIRGEIERLEVLLGDFLRYARPRPPERSPIDLVGLVRATLATLGPELEADRVTIELEAPEGGAVAEVDAGQLSQVLVNLLRNAREALLGNAPGDRRIRVEVASEGSAWVRIAVADSGPGVDPRELSKVGTLFYSTKKGGTGLGLPIARRVAVEHGGELRFESAPGRGLRAVLRLPKGTVSPPKGVDRAGA
jgi:signal transduction histidine kinase